MWAEQHLKLITAILLVQKLARTKPEEEASNSGYEVEVIPWGKTTKFVAGTTKVSFVPHDLTNIKLDYNRDGHWSDFGKPQECITLAYWLEKGFGQQITETTSKPAKKTPKRRLTVAEPGLDQETARRTKISKATPNKAMLPPTPVTLLTR